MAPLFYTLVLVKNYFPLYQGLLQCLPPTLHLALHNHQLKFSHWKLPFPFGNKPLLLTNPSDHTWVNMNVNQSGNQFFCIETNSQPNIELLLTLGNLGGTKTGKSWHIFIQCLAQTFYCFHIWQTQGSKHVHRKPFHWFTIMKLAAFTFLKDFNKCHVAPFSGQVEKVEKSYIEILILPCVIFARI